MLARSRNSLKTSVARALWRMAGKRTIVLEGSPSQPAETPAGRVTSRVDGVRQILEVGLTGLADYSCSIILPLKREVWDGEIYGSYRLETADFS